MKIALLLHKYFPYGGLQRDCLNLARLLAGRGHDVTVVTRAWEGQRPAAVEVAELGTRGASNMARDRLFEEDARRFLAERKFDGLVGFSRLDLGLDVYYAADPCYRERIQRERPFWYRWTRKFKYRAGLERAIFRKGGDALVLLLTDMEVPLFEQYYGTEPERMVVLPPSIRRRDVSLEEKKKLRKEARDRLGWSDAESVVLFVGSGFATKGLDRALEAVADVVRAGKNVVFPIIGTGNSARYRRLGKRLGIDDRVEFLGGRDDVFDFMLGADLLVHPARSENTGTVLVEALVAGTGVLVTDRCGFACHVQRSGAGKVVMSPYSKSGFAGELLKLLDGSWRERARMALEYAGRTDLYSGLEMATVEVEKRLATKSA